MDKFSGALSSSLSLALFPVPARLSGPLPTIVASNESGDNGIDQVQHCYLTVSLHCIPTFTPPISWIGNECSIFFVLHTLRIPWDGWGREGAGQMLLLDHLNIPSRWWWWAYYTVAAMLLLQWNSFQQTLNFYFIRKCEIVAGLDLDCVPLSRNYPAKCWVVGGLLHIYTCLRSCLLADWTD